MSADNAYFIVKDGDKYVPVMYFMSDPEDHPIEPRDKDPRFDTFLEAYYYAVNDYTEYGVSWDLEIDTSLEEEDG